MNKEFYDRLGVSPDASADDLKKAYRQLSKKYHPDINKEPGAEEKYKEIQEAYETLGDPQKRQMYDQFGSTDGQTGGNPFGGGGGGFSSGGFSFEGGFGDLGDIFSQMFGGGFDQNRPRQGEDLQYRMKLSFEEAIEGKTTTIKYKRPLENGSEEDHEVEVKVPAGVDDGQRMRLDEQGAQGKNGGPFGDLFVIFSVEQKSKNGLVRDGADIWFEQDLTFKQAALGDTIQVPTITGEVDLNIPAGTQPGTDFRLKGKGAPNLRRGNNGDQFVKVNVVVPKRMNKKQKEALENFDQEMHKKGLFG